MDSTNIISITGRWLMTVVSALFSMIQPALPYFLICLGFVLLDLYSAYKLAKRVSRKFPQKASGKFLSEKLGPVFRTIAEICAVVLLAHFTQTYITDEMPFNLTKIVCAAICGWQFWSYLENSSSCNGAKWAKAARTIFIDKTERHFDIDLHHIDDGDNETPAES